MQASFLLANAVTSSVIVALLFGGGWGSSLLPLLAGTAAVCGAWGAGSSSCWRTGAHLIGAAMGDLVPGQVGVNEGAFRAFAETLGLGADPAKALSIPLVIRVAQISLAIACVATAVLARRRGPA